MLSPLQSLLGLDELKGQVYGFGSREFIVGISMAQLVDLFSEAVECGTKGEESKVT